MKQPYLYSRYLPDLGLGLQNLLLHKLRTLLTMLGMIFGVSAVIAMLSIIKIGGIFLREYARRQNFSVEFGAEILIGFIRHKRRAFAVFLKCL